MSFLGEETIVKVYISCRWSSYVVDRRQRDYLKNHQSLKGHRRRSVRFVASLVKIAIFTLFLLFFFCGEQSKWKGMQILIVPQAKSDSSRKKPIRHKSFTVKPTKNESGYWMRNSLYTKFYWATTCFNCHLYIFMHIMDIHLKKELVFVIFFVFICTL